MESMKSSVDKIIAQQQKKQQYIDHPPFCLCEKSLPRNDKLRPIRNVYSGIINLRHLCNDGKYCSRYRSRQQQIIQQQHYFSSHVL
uniref:Uncharacterized protein n=1 Tax=Acrobeloides nanus TaxID=290746 RepID=A0A914E943_9BILA